MLICVTREDRESDGLNLGLLRGISIALEVGGMMGVWEQDDGGTVTK